VGDLVEAGGILVAFIILLSVLTLPLPENGTLRENSQLLNTVQQLQNEGYVLTEKHSGLFDIGRETIEYNLTAFFDVVDAQNISEIYYTMQGRLGPKIWAIDNAGAFIYWRSD
jgi:hypothetical protein